MELKGGGAPPPGQQTKMSGTISPRDRLQLWVNIFLLKQKENSGSVTATFRDFPNMNVYTRTYQDLLTGGFWTPRITSKRLKL